MKDDNKLALPVNWEVKKLGEVVDFHRGLTYSKKDEVSYSDKIVLRSGNIDIFTSALDFSELKYLANNIQIPESKKVKKGSILICTANGSKIHLGKIALIEKDYDYAFGGFMGLITPKERMNPKFLFYILVSESYRTYIRALSDGVNINNLKFSDLSLFKIPFPPLSEQQYIVSILDKCFAAIDKAKANAEQNLKNAKELFECYLQGIFENNGQMWEEKKIGDVCEIIMGQSPKGNSYNSIGNGAPLINGPVEFGPDPFSKTIRSKFTTKPTKYCKEGDLILCVRGSTTGRMNIAGFDACIGRGVAAIRYAGNQDWINYFALSARQKIYSLGTGATFPNVSSEILKELKIPIPTFAEQGEIIYKLNTLRAETQKLETTYKKKITDLEDLKKSILRKAFNGELTSSISPIDITSVKSIPLKRIEGISTTDLQAGITALALSKHIEQNKQNTFHHVKAEKIVHLAEYILNIDLDRNPIKDTAGPNDFAHAQKKVEPRARKAGYYTVYKKGDSYEYKPGRQIASIIQKTQECLGMKSDQLTKLIDIMIPMTTQQSEILATVFAAWNNLILSNVTFSDEEIITEARENWHKEKLKIPREKFFSALEWIRRNELLIPKGNGKIVLAK